jgi:hypothetical protein
MSTVRFFEKDHFNVAILAVAAAMTMLVFFVNRNLSDLASSNSFAVEELRSNEFALEVYSSILAGDLSSAAIYGQLDSGYFPDEYEYEYEDSEVEIYASVNSEQTNTPQASTNAHSVDDIYDSYNSSVYGQGLLELTNY